MKNSFKISVYLIGILIVGFLGGCSDARNDQVLQELALSKRRIDMLEEEIRELTLDTLSKRFEDIAVLSPGSQGYSPIKFDLGTIVVMLDNIRPYANGSKMTLSFGNTLSCAIHGLKAKVEYGKVDDKGIPINKEMKVKEIVINEDLYSGAWTKTDVVLEGLLPESLGFVRVKEVEHQSITLRKAENNN